MIRVAKLSGWKRRPHDVVFRIGCRDYHGLRSRVSEDNSLERGESWSVEVFDHFDNRGGFEVLETGVTIHQATVKQFDSFGLEAWQLIKS